MTISRKTAVLVVVFLFVVVNVAVVSADGNVTNYNVTIKQLKNKIKRLNKEIEALKVENYKLKGKINKLQTELNEKSAWDARKIMDKLFIFTITAVGKEYKLIFHEGGLGGVTVYQYVGPWQGDAGKWRQYKQIAFFKGEKLNRGFIKPGIVLRPVWGFKNKTIRVRSIADLIKIEKEFNNINGLIIYLDWVRNKYYESLRYNPMKTLGIALVCVVFGLVFGEAKQPIRRIVDHITVRTMTDFGERRPRVVVLVLLIAGVVITTLFIYANTQNVVFTAILATVLLVLVLLIYRIAR